MNLAELKLDFEFCSESEKSLPVIIVAAGNSTRMQGINKQFLTLGGIPVISKTMLAFENSSLISRIILVAKESDIPRLQLLAEKYSVSKLTDIVVGGENRQQSAQNGLSRLTEDEKKVLIHDGARPFVNNIIIENVCTALEEFPAVTCGVKLKDTIKQINSDGTVAKTLKRDELFSVQTPQGVWANEYREALARFGDLSAFTDDTSIMEAAGHTVKCVEGSYHNIKITTSEDIAVAEGYILSEE